MPRKPIDAFVDQQRPWLDGLGTSLADGVKHAGDSLPAGNKMMDFLHGVWLGHPLHAVLTDVPVGAWTVGAFLDVLSLSGNKKADDCADGAIAIGVAGGLAAVAAGVTDWQHLSGHERRLGLFHGLLNATVIGGYLGSLLLRRLGARPLGAGLGLAAYGVAGLSAYIGGDLAYGAGIGVNRGAWERPAKKFVPVLPEADLKENTPTKVVAKGEDVLLVRRQGQIYALANTCSHMGCPLDKGTLEDDTIECQCHDSHFALADGSVRGGPATYPQLLYEVRIENGQIEVRAANL